MLYAFVKEYEGKKVHIRTKSGHSLLVELLTVGHKACTFRSHGYRDSDEIIEILGHVNTEDIELIHNSHLI